MSIKNHKCRKCGGKALPGKAICYACLLSKRRESKANRELIKQKKKARHEKTKSYRKTLHDKAWGLMSRYIRLKWADDNGNVVCYTCNEVHHYKDQMECGHFWHDRIDFCEDNLKPQCTSCNRFRADKAMAVYSARLLDDLGEAKFKELRLYANTKGNGYSVAELREIIADLKVKLATLSK